MTPTFEENEVRASSYDERAVYICRGCGEPLPPTAVTRGAFEWHCEHGTYHLRCWEVKVAEKEKLLARRLR